MSRLSEAKSIDMTQGKPLNTIIPFAVPILVGNIFQQLYTVVDGIVVGKGVSDAAQAAVGATFSITYMMTCVFLGMGLGAAVLVAQFFGARDEGNVRKAIMSMNSFLILISIPLTIFGMLSAGAFLRLLNVQDDLIGLAKTYMMVYYIGMLPQFGYNSNAGVLQGLGDSKSPFKILAASSILHVILDILFVVFIPLGVAGVALATVISQFFSWILSMIYINRKFGHLNCRFFKIEIDKEIFIELMKIGVPAGIQNALYSVGIMVMSPLINGCGTTFIAGYNAAIKVDGMVYMPITSLTTAITTYVGQNIGAGKMDRVKKGIRDMIFLCIALCAVLCAIVIPFRSQLMYMFTDSADVVAAGNAYLVRVIPLYVISALQYLFIGLLRGMGESVLPTIAALVSLWIARVPSAFWLTNHFGPDNMHWCYVIGWIMGLVILVPYYYSGVWKKHLKKNTDQ